MVLTSSSASTTAGVHGPKIVDHFVHGGEHGVDPLAVEPAETGVRFWPGEGRPA